MELNLKQLGLMTPIQSIVCLALGSFSSSQASELQSINQFTEPQKRSQFQLLVLLDVIIPVIKAKLVDSQNSSNRLSVSFYDPAFTEYDTDFLKRSGFDPLDQEPDLRCEQTTFFYMPHAPLGLYERLISSNYQTLEKNSLDKVILLGNDLQNYLENMSLRDRLSTPLSCLDDQSIESRCAPDLSKLDREMSVYFFNDTNFQWFPRGQTCSSNEG
uniref:SRR1-like domain-containing protein n=1 Tax=Phakopsora pachyrhizi TaxID=170000 RepID=A0A0S1MJE1_PHAPC